MTDNKTFNQLLINTAIASVTNSLVWFALTFWVFLETSSVLATSYVAGVFALLSLASAMPFGSMVDHNKKKIAMITSTIISGVLYGIGATIFFIAPEGVFANPTSIWLWSFIIILMIGSVAGNLRMIALSTTVSLLFKENKDKANGAIGMVNGLGFTITSIISGLLIGYLGMSAVLIVALVATSLVLTHGISIQFKEDIVAAAEETKSSTKADFKETCALLISITGLIGLILFTTFNNFLGGVFMALMDAYGLSLVSVQTWGFVLALTSPGFIIGSALVAKYGLGSKPLKMLLLANILAWLTCILFPLKASIFFVAAGFFVFMLLHPVIEAAEHTAIQTVVPIERQGRVFGIAQSIESMASPVTTFLIGPIAAWFFIPFMSNGKGVELIGSWCGTGAGRGMALVFILAGIIGVLVTAAAFLSKSYRALSKQLSMSHGQIAS